MSGSLEDKVEEERTVEEEILPPPLIPRFYPGVVL